jgi:hypothetical protein
MTDIIKFEVRYHVNKSIIIDLNKANDTITSEIKQKYYEENQ